MEVDYLTGEKRFGVRVRNASDENLTHRYVSDPITEISRLRSAHDAETTGMGVALYPDRTCRSQKQQRQGGGDVEEAALHRNVFHQNRNGPLKSHMATIRKTDSNMATMMAGWTTIGRKKSFGFGLP